MKQCILINLFYSFPLAPPRQLFYGYEVSIYVELNGTNNWNGSVLSIMLLAGSFGAMMPTWVRVLLSNLQYIVHLLHLFYT
jgi:hypothetical protein